MISVRTSQEGQTEKVTIVAHGKVSDQWFIELEETDRGLKLDNGHHHRSQRALNDDVMRRLVPSNHPNYNVKYAEIRDVLDKCTDELRARSQADGLTLKDVCNIVNDYASNLSKVA